MLTVLPSQTAHLAASQSDSQSTVCCLPTVTLPALTPITGPYVTAVGATMLKPGVSVLDQNPEEVAMIAEGGGGVFTPGGGFS
jgi:hypothetical protein